MDVKRDRLLPSAIEDSFMALFSALLVLICVVIHSRSVSKRRIDKRSKINSLQIGYALAVAVQLFLSVTCALAIYSFFTLEFPLLNLVRVRMKWSRMSFTNHSLIFLFEINNCLSEGRAIIMYMSIMSRSHSFYWLPSHQTTLSFYTLQCRTTWMTTHSKRSQSFIDALRKLRVSPHHEPTVTFSGTCPHGRDDVPHILLNSSSLLSQLLLWRPCLQSIRSLCRNNHDYQLFTGTNLLIVEIFRVRLCGVVDFRWLATICRSSRSFPHSCWCNDDGAPVYRVYQVWVSDSALLIPLTGHRS